MHQESPAYQDKEERRLITLASMDNLLKFHEIERQEKHNALKFYSAFLGGGIALLIGISKISTGIEAEIFKYITIILIINLLVVKKLVAVRGASNNIYHEYGRRLSFLLDSHSSDLDTAGKNELDFAFQKYIRAQKLGPLLPKHSADTFEVKGLLFITILFSFTYWLPLSEFSNILQIESLCVSLFVFFFHLGAVSWLSYSILKNAMKMPNVSSNKPIKSDA
ncbi:hypothetical protein TW85_00185 [Marinomonas sp. S3726]|uniref:hypothetical protein n=1 Tax=Marinomonas sp. S3726 TaxID=579484 RepID=UPI0005FA233F|nr:hypothetical protein [Marinomonas sp. S3726]KJZ16440.1 hypothetical protein TW85_00185 [Marinomonas sp. S3726]